MNCKECPYGIGRDSCKKLCPEALEFVNQDYKSKSELTYTDLGINIENTGLIEDNYILYEQMYGTTTDERWLIYKLYFLDNKSNQDIRYHVSYSKRHINRFIKQLKDNILKFNPTKKQRQILELHFLEKLPIKQVSDVTHSNLDYTHEVIKTYISKNIK